MYSSTYLSISKYLSILIFLSAFLFLTVTNFHILSKNSSIKTLMLYNSLSFNHGSSYISSSLIVQQIRAKKMKYRSSFLNRFLFGMMTPEIVLFQKMPGHRFLHHFRTGNDVINYCNYQ